MEDLRPYRVEFQAPLDDRARSVLAAAGIELVGSGGGGIVPPGGGTLGKMDRHVARVFAPSAGEAAANVRDALTDREITFYPLAVEPDRSNPTV
jgi:hypothetical protein